MIREARVDGNEFNPFNYHDYPFEFRQGSGGASRSGARPTNKKATRAAREKKKERKGEAGKGKRKKKSRVYALIQPISRFSAENPTLARAHNTTKHSAREGTENGWRKHRPRCDSLPCHVCALIRGQKEPGVG